MSELIDIIPSKPTISLDSKCLPEIKEWRVSKNYEITLKVRETGVHEDTLPDGKRMLHATFEVINADGNESSREESAIKKGIRPEIDAWLDRKKFPFVRGKDETFK